MGVDRLGLRAKTCHIHPACQGMKNLLVLVKAPAVKFMRMPIASHILDQGGNSSSRPPLFIPEVFAPAGFPVRGGSGKVYDVACGYR